MSTATGHKSLPLVLPLSGSPFQDSANSNSFVSWKTWTVTIESLSRVMAEHPEYYSTDMKKSVSQETWKKVTMQSLPQYYWQTAILKPLSKWIAFWVLRHIIIC